MPPSPRPDHEETDESTFSAWLLVWTIIIAKAGTILLILWAAHDFETGVLLAATSWLWLGLIAAILASPLVFRIRLHRVRAKREALRRSEWMVADELPSPGSSSHSLPFTKGEDTTRQDSSLPPQRRVPFGRGWG